MANSADPDQLASSEANWSGSTLCKGRVYPGSAGQGLTTLLIRPLLGSKKGGLIEEFYCISKNTYKYSFKYFLLFLHENMLWLLIRSVLVRHF